MTTTAGLRLAAHSRQITALLHEARALAAVSAAERDTDEYQTRLATFHARKAMLLAGPSEHDRSR